MFVSCVCHQKTPSDSLSGEPWNPLTFLNIVEVVIDEGTIFNSFEPVETKKTTSELTIHMRNNLKILNVSFWRLEMRLCLIPSWTGGSSRFMPCTSSSSARWASCEASLQHSTSVQKRKGSRSPAQLLPSMRMRITLQHIYILYTVWKYCIYIYTNHNCMYLSYTYSIIMVINILSSCVK